MLRISKFPHKPQLLKPIHADLIHILIAKDHHSPHTKQPTSKSPGCEAVCEHFFFAPMSNVIPLFSLVVSPLFACGFGDAPLHVFAEFALQSWYDGRSVSFPLRFADWWANSPGSSQAASRKKNCNEVCQSEGVVLTVLLMWGYRLLKASCFFWMLFG